VFYAPHRRPEHANREPLVLQTRPPLSIVAGSRTGFAPRGPNLNEFASWTERETSAMGETSREKERLLGEGRLTLLIHD